MDNLVKFFNENNSKILANKFNLEKNENLIHQVVTSYIDNMHRGVKKQKTRSEVSGGGKKPWKQKGTGRARAGSIRSPLWRGGGKIFAAKGIISGLKKINKKVYKKSINIIISQLIRDDRISIINEIKISDYKTKTFLKETGLLKNKEVYLLILKKIDKNINLATRNLKKIFLISYDKINPIILLKYKKILVTEEVLNLLKENLK